MEEIVKSKETEALQASAPVVEPSVDAGKGQDKSPKERRSRSKDDAKGKSTVTAVYNDMVHMYTGERITTQGTLIEIDNWVQVQIDAGKLRAD